MASKHPSDTQEHEQPDTGGTDNQGVSTDAPAEGADDAPAQQPGSPQG